MNQKREIHPKFYHKNFILINGIIFAFFPKIQAMTMNINTDANQAIDKFSGLNGETQDTSVLNSLFSINFKSEEISSDNNIIDKEYLFDEDDIKILDYIFHIIPDFENKKK